MKERYDRFLEGVKDLTRDLRDSTKEIERIKIREIETSSKLEGTNLGLLEEQSKINTR